MTLRRILLVSAVLTSASLLEPSLAGQGAPRGPGPPPSQATLEVHVAEAGGGPIGQAEVKLFSVYQPGGLAQTIGVGGSTTFITLEGNYKIEVRAASYRLAQEDVLVMGSGTTHCYVEMRRDDGSSPQKASDKPRMPEVKGKSRQELDKAMAAIRANQMAEAQKHLDYALKHAKDNPEVQYTAALYALAVNDQNGAKTYLDAAVTLFPDYAAAQTVLAGILLQQGKVEDAIPHLQKAVAVEPNLWRAHRFLSEAYLRANHDLDKSKFHAQRALELGKDKATGTELVLAWAEAAAGNREDGRKVLEAFAHDHPSHPDADRARKLAAGPPFAADAVRPAAQPVAALAPPPAAALVADVPTGPIRRMPALIDALVPPVEPGVACSLPEVLRGAAQRSAEFTDALQRFSANEEFVHDDLDQNGAVRKSYTGTFQYLAALKWPRPDLMVVNEVRSGATPPTSMPVPFVTEGLPSIGLIFHEAHAKNFNFTCEGLGHWRGQPAWQVRFEQRMDRPARIHDWSEKGQIYPTILKGRAWIASGSYHVLRVETDLVKPIPELRLELHHMTIEYTRVTASNGKELWLPSYAEVFSRFRGRFFRQQHDFGNFVLFSVDAGEKIKEPPPEKPQQP